MLLRKYKYFFHISAGTCTHGRMCVYGRYTPAKPVVNSEKKKHCRGHLDGQYHILHYVS